MAPIYNQVHDQVIQPYLDEEMSSMQALEAATADEGLCFHKHG